MVSVIDLWLPILVSAVLVFIGGAIAWMVLPHHKKEWKGLPDETRFGEALKSIGVQPGLYIFPHCPDPKAMKEDAALKARWDNGPWGTLNLWKSQPSFGKNLAMTFLTYVVISVFVAYVTSRAEPAGASYLDVFQVSGAVAFCAYVFAHIPNGIFFGKPLMSHVNDTLDGLAFALLTAGCFAAFWPALAEGASAMPNAMP